MMRRYLIGFLLVILYSPAGISEEAIAPNQALTLERCLELALQSHPSIIVQTNTVNFSKSLVGQAASGFYPQINFAAGFSRNNPATAPASPTTPLVIPGSTATVTILGSPTKIYIPGQTLQTSANTAADEDQYYDNYTASVRLNQILLDFGKTYTGVKAQDYNLKSSRSDLENVSQQITFKVKQAYYGVLQAERNREVALETVEQTQKHLDQAQGFYQVGRSPKFDVTKAEVDFSNAQLNLLKAENNLKIAKATLNNAIGITQSLDYEVVDNLSFQPYQTSFDDALQAAYQDRPDLESNLLKQKSAQESIKNSAIGYLPVVSGTAAYNWAGKDFPLQDGWDLGINLNLPLFNGLLTKYQVDQSKANYNIAKANESYLRQSIYLEVQQAYLNLQAVADSIPIAELTVKQAQENLDLANGRYSAGVGNPIEVADAELAYSNARLTYNQALYDYKIAQATLEKAVGKR